ncbi:purine-cytosine permease family protein [Comamonas jiangduensis]|uniref:purine-cytosine permease family protein n=1 Tax=Comamonas jiangduensis TaxID=1194168 RepID=UPI0024E10DC1|nr:cytosine permease [Comamonas jiangduensis]
MNTSSSASSNQALSPTSPAERVFAMHDHAALWFSLGVGLLVMQVGAYLLPALSPQQALLAIACGSLLGAGLLGWMAKIACDTGLSSAALMTHVYGRQFAKLPIVLNLVQLIGWGTFELVVMRDASVAIGRQAGGMAASYWPMVMTLMWGGVIALLISGSMLKLVRQLIARVALPLVVLSLLWLTWHFVGLALEQGWQSLWSRPGQGGMGWLPAMDLVIAMPISWLPLVADYARHGKDGRSAMRGTWLGFAVANMWCYGLGVLVALTLPSADLVTALLLAQGGLIALTLILIDEVDNAYGDTYSGAMAAHSVVPSWSVRRWGLLLTVLCVLLALVLPMHSIEPFLLTLSSVFVPLFGVILGRLAWQPAAQRLAQAPQWMANAQHAHWPTVTLWLAGIALYHSMPLISADAGSALPTLLVCFVAARCLPRTT